MFLTIPCSDKIGVMDPKLKSKAAVSQKRLKRFLVDYLKLRF